MYGHHFTGKMAIKGCCRSKNFLGKEGDARVSIYKKTDEIYQLKLKASRTFYMEVRNKHGPMPFNLRTFQEETKTKLGVVECVNHKLIEPFQVLYEKSGTMAPFAILMCKNSFPDFQANVWHISSLPFCLCRTDHTRSQDCHLRPSCINLSIPLRTLTSKRYWTVLQTRRQERRKRRRRKASRPRHRWKSRLLPRLAGDKLSFSIFNVLGLLDAASTIFITMRSQSCCIFFWCYSVPSFLCYILLNPVSAHGRIRNSDLAVNFDLAVDFDLAVNFKLQWDCECKYYLT